MTISQLCRHSNRFSVALVALCATTTSIAFAQPATPPQTPPATAAPADDVETLADYARRDPAIAAALELPRNTPAQQLRAVLVLIDLGHPEAAAFILPDLLKTKLDAETGAALVHEFGAARFMELIRLDHPNDGAQAAGPNALAGLGKFAQACLDAAAAQTNDPKRVAELIAQLQSPQEEARYAARVDLRASGQSAIEACFAALAAAKTEDVRANLLAALAEMRPLVDEPTLAVLADARGQLRRDAVELAGHLKLSAAMPWLAALASSTDKAVAGAAQSALTNLGIPLPSPSEAQELVRRRLTDLEATPALPPGDLKQVWWSWDAKAGKLISAEFTDAELRTLATARLSRALIEAGGTIAPADRRLVAIRAAEEATLLKRDPPPEMQAILTAMSPAELSAALAEAVAQKQFAAATGFAAQLGRRGDPSILATSDGRPSPLAAALASPVRSLRFAALNSVMQLAPARQFPGSSGVVEALWYFASGAGDPVAVAAAPVFTRASDWAGQLRGLGYEATPAATGREALIAAADRAAAPRLALVVLDSDLGQPLVAEVLFQLRTSERTARVPILVCTSAPHLDESQRRSQADSLTVVAPRPHGEAAMKELVARTIAVNPEPLPSAETRNAQAAQALGWIAKLLAANAPYDELRRDAALVNRTVYVPDLSIPSLAVLAALGTGDSQSLLADYASSLTLPIESRRRAAEAFAASVKQFGKQLTSQQILQQYDRYNASQSADADTQQILGSILDVLEKRSAPTANN